MSWRTVSTPLRPEKTGLSWVLRLEVPLFMVAEGSLQLQPSVGKHGQHDGVVVEH